MDLRIRTWLIQDGEQWEPCPPVTYPDTGYPSVEAMRRELRRRFGGHTHIEDIPHGVRCTRGGEIQEVTLL